MHLIVVKECRPTCSIRIGLLYVRMWRDSEHSKMAQITKDMQQVVHTAKHYFWKNIFTIFYLSKSIQTILTYNNTIYLLIIFAIIYLILQSK